jgi:acetolactate synthase-1/3 small subunit
LFSYFTPRMRSDTITLGWQRDVTQRPTVERETVLVKVHAPPASRARLIAFARANGGRVADVGSAHLVFELTEAPLAVDAFLDLVRPIGITEMIRSARMAMVRGAPATLSPWTAQADGAGD